MVGLAAVLAAAISLIWLWTAGYLLLEVWGLPDLNRFGLVEVTFVLAAVTLVPVLTWLLVASIWRSTRLSQARGPIETTLAKEGLQGEVCLLREASEAATAQLPRAAGDAKQQRGALAEVSECMADLTIQLHGVLGQMRDFGERAERTQGNLRAIVDHIAEVRPAALPLLRPQGRPDRGQCRLKDRSGVRGLALHYRHDREFRLTADRFMETFEVLLEDAREADPSNGLGAVFVTSDLGKLYLVFARESGRAGAEEQDRG